MCFAMLICMDLGSCGASLLSFIPFLFWRWPCSRFRVMFVAVGRVLVLCCLQKGYNCLGEHTQVVESLTKAPEACQQLLKTLLRDDPLGVCPNQATHSFKINKDDSIKKHFDNQRGMYCIVHLPSHGLSRFVVTRRCSSGPSVSPLACAWRSRACKHCGSNLQLRIGAYFDDPPGVSLCHRL